MSNKENKFVSIERFGEDELRDCYSNSVVAESMVNTIIMGGTFKLIDYYLKYDILRD